MKFSEMKKDLTQRVLVYGPPKCGKTEAMGALAETHDLIWFDLEDGVKTLDKLPMEYQDRIDVIQIPESKGNPVAINTMLKVVTWIPGSICVEHGAWDCAACKKNDLPRTEVNLRQRDWSKTIVVVDSLSALAESAINHLLRGRDAAAKAEWDDWFAQGALMTKFLSAVQTSRMNWMMATHEMEVEREDGTMMLVPVSGTRNFSRNTGKYFDHVAYMRVKGGRHTAGSATTYLDKIHTGSRLGVKIEAGSVIDLRPFFSEDLRKAAMAEAAANVKDTLGASKATLASGIRKPPAVIGGIKK